MSPARASPLKMRPPAVPHHFGIQRPLKLRGAPRICPSTKQAATTVIAAVDACGIGANENRRTRRCRKRESPTAGFEPQQMRLKIDGHRTGVKMRIVREAVRQGLLKGNRALADWSTMAASSLAVLETLAQRG